MACIENIPPALVSQLLPRPDISVKQFLSFTLPLQLNDTIGVDYIKYGSFWSKTPPEPINTSNVTMLIQLSIPSPAMLNLITQEHTQATSNGYEIKLITYAHLPATNPDSKTLFSK